MLGSPDMMDEESSDDGDADDHDEMRVSDFQFLLSAIAFVCLFLSDMID